MLAVEFHANLSCGDIAEINVMQTAAGSESSKGEECLIFMFEKIERISDDIRFYPAKSRYDLRRVVLPALRGPYMISALPGERYKSSFTYRS